MNIAWSVAVRDDDPEVGMHTIELTGARFGLQERAFIECDTDTLPHVQSTTAWRDAVEDVIDSLDCAQAVRAISKAFAKQIMNAR